MTVQKNMNAGLSILRIRARNALGMQGILRQRRRIGDLRQELYIEPFG